MDDTVSELPVSSLSQLLAGRFAGLDVTNGGATGTGSRIRSRGAPSLLLGNDPLVVVDGIRLFSTPMAGDFSVPSRLDDIDVSTIATVEIVRGPEATLLYGSGASGGVIRITTRRGVQGRPHVEFNTQNGIVDDAGMYPDIYSLWGKRTTASVSAPCRLAAVSLGTCTVDSLSHGNLMNIDSLTPVDIGFRNQYHARISGGSSVVQYSLSGQVERETGVFKMPDREVSRLAAERGVSSIPDDQLRPSALQHNSLQANVAVKPATSFGIQLSSMFLDGETRLVPNEAQSAGIGYNAYGGLWRLDQTDSRGVPLAGYAIYPAGDIMSQTTTQRIHRFINSAAADFHPVAWLNVRGILGLDQARQGDKVLDRLNEGPASSTRAGFVTEGVTYFSQRTIDVDATAAHTLSKMFTTRTTVGVQWLRNRDSVRVVNGFGLPVGGTSVALAAQQFASVQNDDSRTRGIYAAEVLGIFDQLFLTGGVRRDSFDGVDQPSVTYPAAGASWLVTKNALGNMHWMDTLKLRAAFSTSGQSPPANLGTTYFTALPVDDSSATLAPLKPEHTSTNEFGADASLFGNASRLSITYYNAKAKDVLISEDFEPSLQGTQIGVVNGLRNTNSGFEFSATQRIIETGSVSASIAVNAWANKNRVTSMPASVPPIFGGDRSTQQTRTGYPMFGLWGRTYSYDDVNKDGILTISELTFSDTASFIASSTPTRELTLLPSLEFFNHKLRFTAQVDSKWGFKKFNNTLRAQCSVASCRGAADKSASFEEQAAAVAAASSGGILTGFYEDASFVRFREASVVYDLPKSWATAIRASRWNIVLTGRNLGVSTKYKGIDPESIVSTADSRSDEYFSTPPTRYFLVRLNVVF